MSEEDAEWDSIGLLKCFIDEAAIAGEFFGKSEKFVRTLEKMKLSDVN